MQVDVLTLPARWKANQQAGAGLNNLGNSCYLNSTLQCLAYIPPLAQLCLARGHSASCARGPGAGPPTPCTFCMLERQLSTLLRSPRGASVSPGEVVRNLHLFSRTFVKGRQEDSHELLVAILDVMERDGRKADVARGAPKGCRTIVEDLFLGRWQSQVRCLVCGHESNTYDSFATLPLDIGQARTVLDGLRAFTEAERLDGSNKYRCDRCRRLVPALKQTTIWDDPNVLVVHLKRFDAGSLLGKISRHVTFPETVDLQPYMTPPDVRCRAEQQHRQRQGPGQGDQPAENGHGASHHYQHQHHGKDAHANGNGHHHHTPHEHHRGENGLGPFSQAADAAAWEAPSADGSGCGRSTYSLTGVLVHQGSSLHSGHYYAFVRDASDRWSCMNDSQVYGTSLEQVRQEQAYLLFYTRQSMKRPRPQPVPPPVPAAVEGAAAVTARGMKDATSVKEKVFGPQLPPHMVRQPSVSTIVAGPAPATAAVARGVDAGSAAGPAVANGGPVRATPSAVLPARPATRPAALATPTARLPAKVVVSPKKAPVKDRGLQHKGGGVPASTKPGGGAAAAAPAVLHNGPGALASQSGAGGEAAAKERPDAIVVGEAADAAARKRKRETDTAEPGAAAAAGLADAAQAPPPSPSSQLRAAVEAEAAALKAGSSWSEGVKRIKGAMEEQLRAHEWVARLRACVRSLQQAGMSLKEALECSGGDPRRQELRRALPKEVLKLGMDELGKMLRPVLLSLGWLGGVMLF